MNQPKQSPSVSAWLRSSVTFALPLLIATDAARCQTLNDFASNRARLNGTRAEALTILGGDYGIMGATYSMDNFNDRDVDLNVFKFGNYGDLGVPRPIGDSRIAWQPRLLGNFGYSKAEQDFTQGFLAGDEDKYKTVAVEFGGGARFWFGDHLSLTPTIAGIYSHIENDYNANSIFARKNYTAAENLGLINWTANTWTVRPGVELAYVYTWRRNVFTFSSDFGYFYTESFATSDSRIDFNGHSQTWKNKIDADVPLGIKLFGQELHSGGYFSRQELYGDIASGLNTEYLYEVHGRLVMDFLGKFWKLKWLGIGGSYIWGHNIDGWSVGADASFKF